MARIKHNIKKMILWSQKYTRTDMLYVAKGGFWLTIGKVSVVLLSFLTMVAFSKWTSKETFGAYQYIISTIGLFGIFSLPGMGNALIRSIAKKKEGMLKKAALAKWKWSSIGSIISIGGGIWYLLHGNTTLGVSLLLASFFFPFPRIFNLFTAFWKGRKDFGRQNKYLIYVNVLEAISFIPIIILTENLIVLMIGYFISRTIFRGIFFFVSLKNTSNKEEDNETISFGKHLTLMQSVSTAAGSLDKIIIWHFLGPVSVAIYSFAQLPVSKLQGLNPLGDLALPKLSENGIKRKKEKIKEKFFQLFLISIPLTVIFIITIPYAYKLIFPEYMASVPYARAMGIILALSPFSLLMTSFLAEMKKKELYIIRIAPPIVKIILFLVLVPTFQIWGIVFAFILSEFIDAGLSFYLFQKI